jgi:hypothetical protein
MVMWLMSPLRLTALAALTAGKGRSFDDKSNTQPGFSDPSSAILAA